MSVSPSPEPRSRLPCGILLPYGVAVLSVALAALLMQASVRLTAADTRPALLVAVTVSALYGGLGPGVMALLLAGLVSRDPVVLLAGAALVAACAIFRRSPSRKEPAPGSSGSEPASTPPFKGLERPAAGSIAFASDTSRSAPPFIEVTTEECNDAFARMYGFRAAVDVIGTRLVVFLPPSNAGNVAYLRAFIRSGYRLEDAESQEIDRYGNAKYFVNNLVGIFERGQLVGAWGTQRDVTEQKQAGRPQEYSSGIPSSKSSSQ